MSRGLLALAVAAALACASGRSPNRIPSGSGPLVSVYRVEVGDAGAAARGARIALWAADPDRLHAEIVAAVGGVRFTIDAGAGRVCVIDVAQGVVYAGEDGTETFRTLVGFPLTIKDAVEALLHGIAPSGVSITREGGEDGSLPSRLGVSDGRSSVALSRVRIDRGSTDPNLLGTGIPPAHLGVRPLEELEAADSSRR